MLQLSVIGNLGADAQVVSGNFNTFTSFTVYHSEKYTDRNGIQQQKVFRVDCVVNWDCKALLPFLRKGTKVYCHGKLRTRTYTDRNGNVCAGIECIVANIELCGGSRPDTDTHQQQQPQPQPQPQPTTPQNPFNDENNEEPF